MNQKQAPRMSPGTKETIDRLYELSGSKVGRPDFLAKLFAPQTRKIIASPTHSPLPVRGHDFCAHYEGEEEAGNYGYGATEEEAIADFIENCAEAHDDRLGSS